MNRLALAALASTVSPRGLICAPRADSDPAKLMAQLNAAFGDFKDKHIARIDAIEAAVDGAFASNALLELGPRGAAATDPKYTEIFSSYLRGGNGEHDLRAANADGYRAQINAALSSGSAGAGGYLAPTEWDREVRKKLENLSPMRRICNVQATGVQAFTTVWNDSSWGSGWVGEEAVRPLTTSPTLSSLEFASGEIYSNVPITQRLLDDAEIDAEGWIIAEIASEFMRQEAIAFLSGNGVNKPFGLLTYVTGGAAADRHPGGNLTVVNSGNAATITPDGLIDFAYSLPAPYRQGATWLMNSTTAAAIAKLKSSTNDYIWREGLAAGQPATLLGYPVEIDEGMPNVAANALAVAFGNFQRGYLINDRMGTRLLRDPYTNKPFVNFYATKRVGGGVLDPNAIRLLRIAA